MHRYAAGGGVFTLVPSPTTTMGLATLEMHMVSFIGQIYGEAVSNVSAATAGSSFTLAGQGLKWMTDHVIELLPKWAAKPTRAAVAIAMIELLGDQIIRHFEGRHPQKTFTRPDEPPPVPPEGPVTASDQRGTQSD